MYLCVHITESVIGVVCLRSCVCDQQVLWSVLYWSAPILITHYLVSTSSDQYYTDQHIHWSPISWSVELAATCNYHLTGQTGRWSLLLPGIVFLSFCVLSFCLNSSGYTELWSFSILNLYLSLSLCFLVAINTDQTQSGDHFNYLFSGNFFLPFVHDPLCHCAVKILLLDTLTTRANQRWWCEKRDT